MDGLKRHACCTYACCRCWAASLPCTRLPATHPIRKRFLRRAGRDVPKEQAPAARGHHRQLRGRAAQRRGLAAQGAAGNCSATRPIMPSAGISWTHDEASCQLRSSSHVMSSSSCLHVMRRTRTRKASSSSCGLLPRNYATCSHMHVCSRRCVSDWGRDERRFRSSGPVRNSQRQPTPVQHPHPPPDLLPIRSDPRRRWRTSR